MTEIEIVQKILLADKYYYNTLTKKDNLYKELTDQEYDSLKDTLRSINPNHPIFSKVGDSPKSSLWLKCHHQIAMGSLEKINSEEEFISWVLKNQSEVLIAEPKIDGLSLSLSYKDGRFSQAITRGGGEIGEDISLNVRNMVGFRDNVTSYFSGSVRCEIILPKDDFNRINSILPDEDKYENCRNAASGISRRLDGKFTKYLQLIYYDVSEINTTNRDEVDKIEFLSTLDLLPVPYVAGDKDAIIEFYYKYKKTRETLSYGIDGIVIKINSSNKQEELGWVNNRPKGQIAWKFDPPGAATTLLSVTWEVGRTGVVTPLGHVEPVKIDGSTIKNVTLYNIAELKKLNINIGDKIFIIKANDIIPRIISVIDNSYTCPECGFKGDLLQQEEFHAQEQSRIDNC